MDYEIRPEPDEAEHEAIVAALAADEAEEQPVSPWVRAGLPGHGGEEDEP